MKTRHVGLSQTPSSHGDGDTQEHERLRSPLRRGTTVLRLDGQHPGMFKWATRLDVADPS
jgi:hypothetical protein